MAEHQCSWQEEVADTLPWSTAEGQKVKAASPTLEQSPSVSKTPIQGSKS